MSGSPLDFFFPYALTNSSVKEHISAVTETVPKLLPQKVKLIQKLSVVYYEIILPIWSALVLWTTQNFLQKDGYSSMDTTFAYENGVSFSAQIETNIKSFYD